MTMQYSFLCSFVSENSRRGVDSISEDCLLIFNSRVFQDPFQIKMTINPILFLKYDVYVEFCDAKRYELKQKLQETVFSGGFK